MTARENWPPAARGYFAIGAERISKALNLGNIMRSAHGFGASFTFTLPLEPPPPPLETDEESDTGIGFPRNGSWAAQNSPNALI